MYLKCFSCEAAEVKSASKFVTIQIPEGGTVKVKKTVVIWIITALFILLVVNTNNVISKL